MMKISAFIALTAVLSFLGIGFAIDIDQNPDLVANLRLANTNIDRMKLLPNNTDWLFDFTKHNDTFSWYPGGVTHANAATFPAVVGQGMAMAVINLGPCSVLPAQLHPRAANFVLAINGKVQTIVLSENGAKTITQNLRPGQLTIFPIGSIHTMMNTGCERAQLVSALNSEDPGTLTVANALFGFPDSYVQTAMGLHSNVTGLKGSIPSTSSGVVQGLDQCTRKCKSTSTSKRALDYAGKPVKYTPKPYKGMNFGP